MTPSSPRASAGAVRQLLTDVLRNPAEVVNLPQPKLDLALRVARRSRLLGALASRLCAFNSLESLPPVATDQLQSALIAAEARARVGRWELNRIAWALDHDLPDVPIVALKGCAYLLVAAPNAAGRMFADIDMLVPESRLRDVETCLLQHGWRTKELTTYDDRYYRDWTHELPPLIHAERGVEVDLHHSLLMRTARLKPRSELLFDSARDVRGSRFKVLAPVDMVLHAIVHLFYGGDIGDALRELVDIDELLRHFAATEPKFWDQFWPRAEELDLARPAFYGLRYARELLGAPVPERVIAASRAGAPVATAMWLMDTLVPRALFPQHPDAPSRATGIARFLLYIRSHWVKMPPLMLARHLSFKFYLRQMKRQRVNPTAA